jgi:hypothetical protein
LSIGRSSVPYRTLGAFDIENLAVYRITEMTRYHKLCDRSGCARQTKHLLHVQTRNVIRFLAQHPAVHDSNPAMVETARAVCNVRNEFFQANAVPRCTLLLFGLAISNLLSESGFGRGEGDAASFSQLGLVLVRFYRCLTRIFSRRANAKDVEQIWLVTSVTSVHLLRNVKRRQWW